jgi:hypothetical protein
MRYPTEAVMNNNVRNVEKQKAQMQYARAVITGKEKYTAKLRRELDLVGILR